MALHTRTEQLVSLRPDIGVISECAMPQVVKKKAKDFGYSNAQWICNGKHKGLGGFSFGEFFLDVDSSFDPVHELFLPVKILGPASFNLLAV